MNRNKELNELVNRLNRIFPELKLWDGSYYMEEPEVYVPPYKLDWYDIIEILDKNGLEIKNKKEI
jgi:hypothetical protein